MSGPHFGLVITVVTESHISSETWHISNELADAIRAELGEPEVRQMIPIAMAAEVVDDPRHVAL